jgi:hypothetical protein
VSWEVAWAEAAVARQFVQRLTKLKPAALRPAIQPLLDRDPYLSAWINVEAALGAVRAADRERLTSLLEELDVQVEAVDMTPSLREAAQRAIRGLLARRWLLTPESFTFVYEPFESIIPLNSLAE